MKTDLESQHGSVAMVTPTTVVYKNHLRRMAQNVYQKTCPTEWRASDRRKEGRKRVSGERERESGGEGGGKRKGKGEREKEDDF